MHPCTNRQKITAVCCTRLADPLSACLPKPFVFEADQLKFSALQPLSFIEFHTSRYLVAAINILIKWIHESFGRRTHFSVQIVTSKSLQTSRTLTEFEWKPHTLTISCVHFSASKTQNKTKQKPKYVRNDTNSDIRLRDFLRDQATSTSALS